MALHDRIREARKALGITQTQLGEMLGVAKTTVSGWEKNHEPTAAQIGAIADALMTDVTYLMQDEIRIRHETHATQEEMVLIKKYRSLDESGKKFIDYVLDRERERVDAMQAMRDAQEVPDNVVPFPLSLQAASAGTGVFLGEDSFRTIRVVENYYTARAKFALPVQGDSMEPIFHDGDIILVDGAEEIPVGKIGVFTINGEGFVKKLGENELIPLNPAYSVIPLNEFSDIKCNGEVIGVLDPAWIMER